MDRRKAIQIGTFAAFSATTLGTVGCNKGNVLTWSTTVITALEQLLPIFQDLLPGSVPLITKALAVARDLQAALKAGSPTTVDFLEQLIAPGGLFDQLAKDTELITDPEKRKIVSGILALAGIALALIATYLQQGTPPAVVEKARAQNKSGVAVIQKVAASKILERALAELKLR